MKRTAVIYTRVSTDAQAEKGYSLRDQEDKIRHYCNQNSIEILEHYQEDHSAKNFNRPEWKLLMAYLKNNKNIIDEFVFVKWDRFSRNFMEGMRVLEEIKSLGIEINCLENNVDDSIPENKLLQTIALVLPEIENARRSMNTIDGMRRAMKEGRWPRKAPRGYKNTRDAENRIMVIVDDEIAPLIRKAFKMMSSGNMTQEDIRKELQQQGLICSKSNFPLLLQNKFYLGKIVIPAYKDEEMQIIDGLHEPIVDENLFYKVQDVLEGRNKKKPMSGKKFMRPEMPLRGFMICHNCGAKMTGSASKGNGGDYWYYHCCSCGVRFKAPEVNNSFDKLLKKIELKDEFKELFKLAVKNHGDEMMASKRKKAKNNDALILKYEARLKRLENSFLDGEISGNDFSSIKGKVEEDIKKLKLDQKEILTTDELFLKNLTNGIETMSNIYNIYDASNIEGKRRIIGSIFPRKFIFDKNITRTDEINEVVRWMMSNNRAFQRLKIERNSKKMVDSSLVAPPGLEPGSKV